MEPLTAMECLEILLETIDGYEHSWNEVERAKKILKLFIKEATR